MSYNPERWDWLISDIAAWQAKQFPETTTEGARNHLEREVLNELKTDPNDPEEWADALFMSIQGGWKASNGLEAFFRVVEAKLNKNERREWPDRPDADNVYEHVKG